MTTQSAGECVVNSKHCLKHGRVTCPQCNGYVCSNCSAKIKSPFTHKKVRWCFDCIVAELEDKGEAIVKTKLDRLSGVTEPPVKKQHVRVTLVLDIPDNEAILRDVVTQWQPNLPQGERADKRPLSSYLTSLAGWAAVGRLDFRRFVIRVREEQAIKKDKQDDFSLHGPF